jgi:hypothetical protein
MAKKNFDAFINAAGKKPKPTPEEVEAMAKQLHKPATPVAAAAPIPAAVPPPVVKEAKAAAKPKPPSTANRQPSTVNHNAEAEAPKEKVRITIDLAKDLYKRMKLAVVQNETEISAYVRQLIEKDLGRQ